MFDEIGAAMTDSTESPYLINLLDPAVFSITDSFNIGDTYSVYNFGTLILTTSVGAGDPFPPSDAFADSSWESGVYSIGSVMLPAGNYSITVQGDGIGGVPAGLYTRLDRGEPGRVPETGSTAALFALALVGVGVTSKRLKK